MRNIAITVLILALIVPPLSYAEFADSAGNLQLAMRGQRGRQHRGRSGKRFGFGNRGRRGFHRGDLTDRFYYRYPRYFYRNYGGIRKFYPRENRSYYPNQGGSDYREWFYFPRR